MLVLFWLSGTGVSHANVYATDLRASVNSLNPLLEQTVELSYRLNESADLGVIIDIYKTGGELVCTLTGGSARGVNTVVWNGKDNIGVIAPRGSYYFIVTAADDGHTTPELISMDEPGNIMYAGRGIDVNINPDSPFYGMVYISNGSTGTSKNPGALKQYDGVYSFWPDATPVTAFIDTLHFSNQSGYSPFRLNVGDDDKIYIGDFLDGWESVWSIDGDLSAASLVQILAPDDSDPNTSPTGNHGNILTAIAKGRGANRILYTTDEDFYDYDVWGFTINDGPFPFAAAGSMLIGESDSLVDVWDFALDRDGTFLYACDDQDAASPLNPIPPPSFAKWDLTTNPPTCIWSSPTTEVVHNVDGIGYSDKRKVIAGSCRITDPYIFILDATNGILINTITNPGGGRNRDVAFDDVGNLYVVNSTSEWWRVFSPPDGPNSFSTKSTFNIEISTAVTMNEKVVRSFELSQCYPNPFNPMTTINFYLPTSAEITLTIINLKGKTVKYLATGWLTAGNQSVSWNGREQTGNSLPSGIYFCQLRAGDFVAQKKMVLAK